MRLPNDGLQRTALRSLGAETRDKRATRRKAPQECVPEVGDHEDCGREGTSLPRRVPNFGGEQRNLLRRLGT
jgi:hypothetical protein